MKRKPPVSRERLFNWEREYDLEVMDHLFGVREFPRDIEAYIDCIEMLNFVRWGISTYSHFVWLIENRYENKVNIKKTKHDFIKMIRKLNGQINRINQENS